MNNKWSKNEEIMLEGAEKTREGGEDIHQVSPKGGKDKRGKKEEKEEKEGEEEEYYNHERMTRP